MLLMPTAVLALAEELGVPAGSGHRLEVHCNHFADPNLLLPRIQAHVRAAIVHPYLVLDEWHGWSMPEHGLGGRLEEEEDEEGTPGPRVVVDGRSLTWEALGSLLKPYVGWTLELRLGSELPLREGDTSGKITVRPPTRTEMRAATRALRQTPGGYFLDSTHYPSRDDWAHGRQE
jgi:hypothetical protein